jgi:hypothetical protein
MRQRTLMPNKDSSKIRHQQGIRKLKPELKNFGRREPGKRRPGGRNLSQLFDRVL